MRLQVDGAERYAKALSSSEIDDLIHALPPLDHGSPGTRIHDLRALEPWTGPDGSVGRIAAAVLGEEVRPVRAILFDKTATGNWAVGWHQDRTIAVESAHPVEGFQNWNKKSGIVHVEPPFELLATMLTVRVHIDRVDSDNGPLLIIPGSDRLGRLTEEQISRVVREANSFTCLAERGDVWAYKTPIVHSSGRARGSGRRRVLQVDYSAASLPVPLRWALTQH